MELKSASVLERALCRQPVQLHAKVNSKHSRMLSKTVSSDALLISFLIKTRRATENSCSVAFLYYAGKLDLGQYNQSCFSSLTP